MCLKHYIALLLYYGEKGKASFIKHCDLQKWRLQIYLWCCQVQKSQVLLPFVETCESYDSQDVFSK